MNNECNVIVIGAGASGMMAALSAEKSGANVVIIERNVSAGKKLAATGNGRCNFTNSDADNMANYYSENKQAAGRVLSRLPVANILDMFDAMGITPNMEDAGKYFPLSGQASSVVEILERNLADAGVDIIYGTKVNAIDTTGKKLRVIAENSVFEADRVIIAAGGMASPDLGSDGSAYELAKSIGHTVTGLMPVIVQLKTKDGFYKRLNGLRINAEVSLIVEDRVVRKERGDVMFYDYGLSGSTVFRLSCQAAYALAAGKKVWISLNLAPVYTQKALNEYITSRCAGFGRTAEEMLVGFIHKKLIPLVVDASGTDKQKNTDKFGKREIDVLCRAVSDMRFAVTGTKGWENAQATAGGIPLDEVDIDTLRSKFDSRIGFCGEILDVAGECGGFNLTWAWASGFVCGSCITK